jgi:RNA polymerase sigma-70 factor (ECF subfamily)
MRSDVRRDGPPDKRLFRRARHGDRQAFVVLLRRYDPRLRRLVLRLVADPARVDVVLNRAYLRAWRSLPHVEPPESVAEWIYRVVYNACVNEVRWAPARPMAGPPEGPWVPLPLASPSRRLAGLRALSAEDRVALVLVDGEGFTLEAAANILKKPEVDVAADVMRARQLWRRLVVGEPEPRSVRATVVLAPSAAEVEAREVEAAAAVEAAANGDPRGHVKVVDPEAAAEATKPRPRPKPATRTSPDGQATHPAPAPTPETESVPAEQPAPAGAPATGGPEDQAPPSEATSPRSARRWPFSRKSKQPKPPTDTSPPEPEAVVPAVAATADPPAEGVEAPEAAAPADDTSAAVSDAPAAADAASEGVASSGVSEPDAVVPAAAATADGPAEGVASEDASEAEAVVPDHTATADASPDVALGPLPALPPEPAAPSESPAASDGAADPASETLAPGVAATADPPVDRSADGVEVPDAATVEDDAEVSAGGADGEADVAPEVVAGTSADDTAGGAKGARAGRPPARRGTGARRARVKPVAADGAEAVLAAKPVASDDPTSEEQADEPAPAGPVFVVSIPVAPEATDVSEAAAEVDPGSSGVTPADDDTAPERRRTSSSGAAGARRKRRRGDVKRDPRTRGRGAAGGEGSKTDHGGDGQGRSDGPRETS